MCLTVDTELYGYKLMIAKKDITCYKILYRTNANDSSGTWYKTPWYNFVMRLNIPYKEHGDFDIVRNSVGGRFFVNGGGFHSFAYEEDARTYINDMWLGSLVIAECVIPKGSEYYTGIFGSYKCYCSKEIVLKKEVVKDLIIT